MNERKQRTPNSSYKKAGSVLADHACAGLQNRQLLLAAKHWAQF